MERRIASIIILISPDADTVRMNHVLGRHSDYIIGRMGVNLRHRNLRIISLIIEADNDQIGALSGQLGLIRGIKVKTAILKTDSHGNDLSSGKIQDPGQADGAVY